jgi:hypothetical protein
VCARARWIQDTQHYSSFCQRIRAAAVIFLALDGGGSCQPKVKLPLLFSRHHIFSAQLSLAGLLSHPNHGLPGFAAWFHGSAQGLGHQRRLQRLICTEPVYLYPRDYCRQPCHFITPFLLVMKYYFFSLLYNYPCDFTFRRRSKGFGALDQLGLTVSKKIKDQRWFFEMSMYIAQEDRRRKKRQMSIQLPIQDICRENNKCDSIIFPTVNNQLLEG